jgi:hypothetical protein
MTPGGIVEFSAQLGFLTWQRRGHVRNPAKLAQDLRLMLREIARNSLIGDELAEISLGHRQVQAVLAIGVLNSFRFNLF